MEYRLTSVYHRVNEGYIGKSGLVGRGSEGCQVIPEPLKVTP